MNFRYISLALICLSLTQSLVIPNIVKQSILTNELLIPAVASIESGNIVLRPKGFAEAQKKFEESMLLEHNLKRALHGVPNVTWSNQLQKVAQSFANNYDCSMTTALVHSKLPYGENISLGYDAKQVVDAWYNEIDSYDYATPGYGHSTGHFTQVVWKSTQEIGCARVSCGAFYGQYIVCEYNSAGNIDDVYEENVLPLI